MKKKTLFIALALVAAILIVGVAVSTCSGGKAKAAVSAESDAPVFAVNTTTAVRGQIKDYLTLSGDVVAGSTVDAYSDAAGKVTRLFVAVGDSVAKDAPLAEVDPSRPGMSFIPAVLKAPIAGTVVALNAELGMTISQAAPLVRLARTDALELRTFVAERYVSKVRIGLNAEIGLDAYPGLAFKARVKELNPVLDPASRTMEIRLALSEADARLKAGMFAKVKLITEDKADIVKVPASAVVRRFGESFVFVVEADPADAARTIVRRVAVSQGILVDDKVEILSGLAAGAQIVVRGQSLLEEGSRVNVVERLAPLSTAD